MKVTVTGGAGVLENLPRDRREHMKAHAFRVRDSCGQPDSQ